MSKVKSAAPVFVDMQTLEARAGTYGYSRRRDLSARRLLNGNYLTVAVSQAQGRSLLGQRYAIRLVETTNGHFYQKNGNNVVKIHCEIVATKLRNGVDNTVKWVNQFEAQIDLMIDLDRQRLSNGNYLTIFEDVQEKAETYVSLKRGRRDQKEEHYSRRTRTALVVETTDGYFSGKDCENFVKIHAEFDIENWSVEGLAAARVTQARIFTDDARNAIHANAA